MCSRNVIHTLLILYYDKHGTAKLLEFAETLADWCLEREPLDESWFYFVTELCPREELPFCEPEDYPFTMGQEEFWDKRRKELSL